MSQTTPNALLIFIKNPVKGNVKTRLAATVGDEKALKIYNKLLGYTRTTVQLVQADKQVWYARHVDSDDAWGSDFFSKRKQQGDDLGERMQHAFRQAFAEGYKRVVIIGSDCAELMAENLQQAYKSLHKNDVVIGPATDGGYYLLGMSRYLPVLFENKVWSTRSVFAQTRADCEAQGFSYHILEELNDVDTEADWNKIKDQL